MKRHKTNRRSFVKNSLAVASGSFLLSSSAASFANIIVPKKKQALGVALVGLGHYSTDLLAPALQQTKHCELEGIVTGSPEKIPVWQKKYNIADANVYNYENMHAVADNEAIDVVYIVLPPSMHAEYGMIAANAGKNVWCEKPMDKSSKACQQLIDTCNQNGVKLSIGYRMHHEPNTQTIIKWAGTKPYGAIENLTARAGYYDGRTNHWKQKKAMGGGAMYDMGVYPLNAVRYATGLEPITVTAHHETKRPDIYDEVDETTFFELEFPDGIKASGATSFGQSMNGLHVEAANGWYELKPFQSYSGIKGQTSDGKQLNKNIPNQQAKQMDDDSLAIINNTNVLVPGEEGLRDIKIVEAIYQAATENRRVKL